MTEVYEDTEQDYERIPSETLSRILDADVARMQDPNLAPDLRRKLEEKSNEIMFILSERDK